SGLTGTVVRAARAAGLRTRRDVALELVQPDPRVPIRGCAPVAAGGEIAAGNHLGTVGQGRALELADLKKAEQEHREPLLHLRDAVRVLRVIGKVRRPGTARG